MLCQLYPSRLTITPERRPLTMDEIMDRNWSKELKAKFSDQFKKNFAKDGNPFILSKASKRKIFDSINSMYVISPPRKVTMKNGKELYNFRLNFITLTLPSSQKHSDVHIKSECLNQLLIELRKKYSVENYVWKAELQQNQNIHFHLITDRYIDYQALRRRWNRIINKLGYVDAYRQKMSKLSLSDYHKLRNKSQTCDFKISAAAYAQGKKCGWQNPNSVDVQAVKSKKDLAVYLAKYIAKDINPDQMTDEELERTKTFGRSWSRSYSLAQLQYKNKFQLSEITRLIEYFKERADVVKHYVDDWCQVFYFNAADLSKAFQKWHRLIIVENAKMYNYPIPEY